MLSKVAVIQPHKEKAFTEEKDYYGVDFLFNYKKYC